MKCSIQFLTSIMQYVVKAINFILQNAGSEGSVLFVRQRCLKIFFIDGSSKLILYWRITAVLPNIYTSKSKCVNKQHKRDDVVFLQNFYLNIGITPRTASKIGKLKHELILINEDFVVTTSSHLIMLLESRCSRGLMYKMRFNHASVFVLLI